MADTDGGSNSKVSPPPLPRPTITLPPRSSFGTFFTVGPGSSPGPMTLVSNFFSDHYPDSDCYSFSQLLAGAMASPAASISAPKPSFSPDDSANNSSSSSFSKEKKSGDGSEKNLGFKQNRPMNLVVAHSPMFMIPPGLSPSGFLNSPGFFSPAQSPFGMSHQQALAHVTAQAALSQSYMHIQSEYQPSSLAASAESLTQNPSLIPCTTVLEKMHTILSDPESSKMESSEVSQSDKKPLPASLAVDKPVNDGYNWRKYGQKQVKASEYPRSYYKCTQLNCPVKKKVERSIDGQISEVIYKGQHNHELPRPNKRAKDGGGLGVTTKSQAKPELCLQDQIEMRSDEVVPFHPVPVTDKVPTQLTSVQLHESIDREETDDAEPRLDEGDDDEPNPKKRNTEVGTSELASSHKAVTEPRIVVQTRSEVDLLDDGYKWRKYGQKVVKGNPHPRSYYKCTHVGCNVRKHVERASTDPKAVVTSYEGKHNHDVLASRNRQKEMDFGKDQRQGPTQLKEEKISA